MNHTQTAQAAVAAAEAGQVPEIQAQAEQPQEQTVQIGFEKALVMMNPDWRNALLPDQVNQFRHFYHQGVQHISFLIEMSSRNMQQNLSAVMNTVIVTGNEEQIAKMQREAQEAKQAEEAAAAAAENPKSKKASKAHKAPTKAKPAVAANRGAPKAPQKATATYKAASKAKK